MFTRIKCKKQGSQISFNMQHSLQLPIFWHEMLAMSQNFTKYMYVYVVYQKKIGFYVILVF
jgi:hypothetical protein